LKRKPDDLSKPSASEAHDPFAPPRRLASD
jgi:hypothetical protein